MVYVFEKFKYLLESSIVCQMIPAGKKVTKIQNEVL